MNSHLYVRVRNMRVHARALAARCLSCACARAHGEATRTHIKMRARRAQRVCAGVMKRPNFVRQAAAPAPARCRAYAAGTQVITHVPRHLVKLFNVVFASGYLFNRQNGKSDIFGGRESSDLDAFRRRSEKLPSCVLAESVHAFRANPLPGDDAFCSVRNAQYYNKNRTRKFIIQRYALTL